MSVPQGLKPLVTPPFPPRQENVCKSTIKDLLTCSLKDDYDSAADAWKASNTCFNTAQGTLSKCRGGTVVYKDKLLPGANEPGYPAYAAAGTVSKLFAMQGLVAIPSQDQKVRLKWTGEVTCG